MELAELSKHTMHLNSAWMLSNYFFLLIYSIKGNFKKHNEEKEQ
jgi:hypothetical protein